MSSPLGKTHEDAVHWGRLAAAALESGALEQAEAAATTACEIDPKYFKGWVTLAIVRARRGMNQPAARCFMTALALKPNDIECWTDLGELYVAMLDYERAAQAFTQAIALDPDAQHPSGRRARAVVGRTLSLLKAK